jgi:hypothetical protein
VVLVLNLTEDFINHDLKLWQILGLACFAAAVMELIEFIFSRPGGVFIREKFK